MKNIAILGSTGSIGRNSLEVIANLSGQFRVTYLTAHKNIDLLRQQIERFHPRGVVVLDPCNANVLTKVLDGTTEVLVGE
ncbi:MAG TPA: 1-deoxy-D-xylulose-5-phosphate reductoisomerase, partial [Terriglobia bacterium]|nr:1-deoxy-D-xylulose-5-phosphate reductoisomerase [Terriglobia bacterium]